MNEHVRVFIERLKAALLIETDEELASRIGYSKQAIANWRRRGAVPNKARTKIAQLAGPEFAADEWEQLRHVQREKAILYACLPRIFARLTSTYPQPLAAHDFAKLGMQFNDLEEGLLSHIRDEASHGASEVEIIQRLWERLDDDKLIEVAWFFIDVGKVLRS
jgi:hypothetical protein